MENGHDIAMFKHPYEKRGCVDFKGVNQKSLFSGGNLDKTDFFLETVHGIGFQVHPDNFFL
jgi:hypothetical protein